MEIGGSGYETSVVPSLEVGSGDEDIDSHKTGLFSSLFTTVCVCACACVHVCVHECVCECVCACFHFQTRSYGL